MLPLILMQTQTRGLRHAVIGFSYRLIPSVPCRPGSSRWPAPGSEDTELGVLMELEVDHGETEVYAGVQT
jgi:hypothetical protein